MATNVQSKTYFPGSMMDLNNGFPNAMWDVYHDDRTSGSEKSQCYDSFLMRQTMDVYPGYAKEQMRQTILKQESIFRHQLEELHRVYKRQRDLMNELTMKEHYNFSMPAEASKSSHFLSQVPSRITKEAHSQVDTTFGRVSISESNSIFSSHNPLQGKCTLKGNVHNLSTERAYNLADLNEPLQAEEPSFAASLSNKNSVIEKLQKQDSSANSNSGFWYLSKISQQDLKEKEGQIAGGDHMVAERPKKEQPNYSFANGKTKCYDNGSVNGSFSQQCNLLQAEPKKSREHFLFPVSDQNKVEPRRKSTIFGVELCERSHTPSFDSSQSSSRDQNTSTLHLNHWFGSSDASRQIPEDFAGNKRVKSSSSRLMTSSSTGVPYQNGGCIPSLSTGISSKVSVSDILEKTGGKNNITDGQKNLENGLPSWLMAKSSLGSEWTKGKEPTIYQMNLDSLQHHSQQFFKKAEMTKGAHDPKVQTDNPQGMTKILGVPIIDVPDNSKDLVNHGHDLNAETKDFVKENGKNNCMSELRHQIDLNLSFEEEETPSLTSYIPEAIVKIARMEIDLEVPAVPESETDPSEIRVDTSKLASDETLTDAHEDLVKVAAEAIMSISSSELHETIQKAPEPADTLLRWFADVIASGDDKDSGNVKDDEESIPKGMDYFEYMTLKLQEIKEEYYWHNKPMILEEKEEVRKRTTKGRRGRQRKDFQRDVLPGIVSLSRREVSEDLQTFEEAFSGMGVPWQSSLARRKGGGRGRRRLVVPSSSSSQTPPPPPPQQIVCREVALEEKSLSGWGKRTRRLPRQRSCQNGGGGNHQSLALKC